MWSVSRGRGVMSVWILSSDWVGESTMCLESEWRVGTGWKEGRIVMESRLSVV